MAALRPSNHKKRWRPQAQILAKPPGGDDAVTRSYASFDSYTQQQGRESTGKHWYPRLALWSLLFVVAFLHAPNGTDEAALLTALSATELQGVVGKLDNETAPSVAVTGNAQQAEMRISDKVSGSAPAATGRINVFYHTFTGSSPDLKNHTRNIVLEQFRQVHQASSAMAGRTEWTLRYRSVGTDGVVNPAFMDPLCQLSSNLQCEYQGHVNDGHEETTMQQMHDFCRSNPNDTVVYIHTKGSFHNKKMNNMWRQPLTMGAVSPTCIETLMQPPTDNSNATTCNVCGTQFYPLWNLMYPGNMFSAKCSYVSKLVPLLEYRTKMAEIVDATSTNVEKGDDFQNPGLWRHDMYKHHYREDRLGITGLERYSNEQWIGSHPSIRPCDLMGVNTKLVPHAKFFRRKKRLLEQSVASPAPGALLGGGNWFRFDKEVFQDKGVRHSGLEPPFEYFLTPGILYRFYKIYGIFPERDSWIWEYYPEGTAWRKKLFESVFFANGTLDESRVWG